MQSRNIKANKLNHPVGPLKPSLVQLAGIREAAPRTGQLLDIVEGDAGVASVNINHLAPLRPGADGGLDDLHIWVGVMR